MEISLEVRPRAGTGKGPARRARAAGLVPAVFYGPSVEPKALLVDARELGHALHTEAGANVLINLQIDGNSRLTVPREIHRHPIKNTVLHLDFVNVARDVAISAHVPVHLTGESHGVKEGGQLDQHLHEVHVEALPAGIPPAIELDVTPLGIGESFTVADLPVPSGVEVLTSGEETVVAVTEATVMELKEELEEVAPPEGEETAPSASEKAGTSEQ